MNPELFKTELTQAIKTAITQAKKSGTVAIGKDCLWQCLRITSPNSPRGTNSAWVARQVFDEIVTTKPFSKFVY